MKRRKLAQQHRLDVAGASPSGSVGETQAVYVLSITLTSTTFLPRGSGRHWEPYVSGKGLRTEPLRCGLLMELPLSDVKDDPIRSSSFANDSVAVCGDRIRIPTDSRSSRFAVPVHHDGSEN